MLAGDKIKHKAEPEYVKFIQENSNFDQIEKKLREDLEVNKKKKPTATGGEDPDGDEVEDLPAIATKKFGANAVKNWKKE